MPFGNAKKGAMSEPSKNVTFTVTGLDEIVEAAVEKALAKRRPAKLQFTTQEAAAMLGVKDSWLAAKARAGEVSYHRQGHKVFFTQQDIDEIMARSAVSAKNGKVE